MSSPQTSLGLSHGRHIPLDSESIYRSIIKQQPSPVGYLNRIAVRQSPLKSKERKLDRLISEIKSRDSKHYSNPSRHLANIGEKPVQN